VGFDTAEEVHEAVLLTVDGERDTCVSCRNRLESVEDTFGRLLTRVEADEDLVVVVEAARGHARVVFEVARRLGLTVWQVSTVAVNHFRDLEGQPRKDDSWDAYLAARMVFLRMRSCRLVADPRPQERMLARRTRARRRMVEQRTALILQLRAVLLELVPEVLSQGWKGPRYDSVTMREILARWPALIGLERARRTSVVKVLRSCRIPKSRREEWVESLRRISREILVSDDEREAIAEETQDILAQITMLDEAIARVESRLRIAVRDHPIASKLLEMPGVGLITAAVLVGELLPVARNNDEPSSATYAGVTPLSRKSGTSLNSSVLCRGSNKAVLNAMFMSATASLEQSALDRAYYDKKRKTYAGHPKPHTAATLALARQRHKVIHRLLTTDKRYDKEKLIASHLDRTQRASTAESPPKRPATRPTR
jgi:transposase